jgi:cytochrome c
MHPLHFCFALLAVTAIAEPAGDVQRGKALYQARCIACHSVKYNGVGPAHKGVFGRAAGTAPNYEYSPALKASGITWTPQNLDRWLADPEKLVPGQKMGFMVPDAQERADLIAFLKSVSE